MRAGDIDVLRMDVALAGGMSGMKLAETVQSTPPATKVIVMSGYPEKHLQAKGSATSDVHLLKKPFGADEVATAISEALGERKRQ